MERMYKESNERHATWIWYPGDFEVWLGNRMNNRRTDRGAFFPPFWKQDSHYVTVEFSKRIALAQPETVNIKVEGQYNIKLDGKMFFGMPAKIDIPAGEHSLNIKVWNQNTPPALFVDGDTIVSDGTWKVTNEDKEWIDDSGKASDTSASVYMGAGSWNFDDADDTPSHFQLKRKPLRPVDVKSVGNARLYDFGRETFGYLVFEGVTGEGEMNVFYGESSEEAQDREHCETLDRFAVTHDGIVDMTSNTLFCDGVTPNNKAFRYVMVELTGNVALADVSMQYEYLPETIRGSFRCDDDEINRMWEIGEYTLQLTTREFFIDGIKRDRWTWSGDAYQSYLMNYYLYFDSDTVKRTIWQLRGKDPVTGHVNTIMDYTFYWFMSVYDYYMYTGDSHFVTQIYPRMQSLMDYVIGRRDRNGMVQGLAGDWVFVDWSPQPMSKQGELSFEQILFCRSLETMRLCAQLVGDDSGCERYAQLADELKKKLIPTFWDEQRQAIVHHVVDPEIPTDDTVSTVKSDVLLVTKEQSPIERYSNMFALFFSYLDDKQKVMVVRNVLHNDEVMPITTPYMRFYEMEALCMMGGQTDVMRQMKDYWGGMMRQGATTFWEAYDPTASDHLAMYGRPYGKSLCHAWGASPIYLLGKYFLGVRPTAPGYATYEVRPSLGGLRWMEGAVPTPDGEIKIHMDEHSVTVESSGGVGTLYIKGEAHEILAHQKITVEY